MWRYLLVFVVTACSITNCVGGYVTLESVVAFDRQPNCLHPGSFEDYAPGSELHLSTINTEKLSDCIEACLNNYKDSKRGVFLYYSGSPESKVTLGLGRHGYDKFANDRAVHAAVSPCYGTHFDKNGPEMNAVYKTIDAENVIVGGNIEVEGKPELSGVYVYRRYEEKEICKRAHGSSKTSETVGCTAYTFNMKEKTCALFDNRNPYWVRSLNIPNDDVFSGLTFCRKLILPEIDDLHLSDGCVAQKKEIKNAIETFLYVPDEETCRKKCKSANNCEIATYFPSIRKCQLHAALIETSSVIENPDAVILLKNCRTCTPRYFSENGGQCQSCIGGFYCTGGKAGRIMCNGGDYCPEGSKEPKKCPAGYFCPKGSVSPTKCATRAYCPEGSEKEQLNCPSNLFGMTCEHEVKCQPSFGKCEENKCYGFNGDGYCTGCTDITRSGNLCHHKICQRSDAASRPEVKDDRNILPQNFKWEDIYAVEHLTAKQSLRGSSIEVTLSFESVSTDIASYSLTVNGVSKTFMPALTSCQIGAEPTQFSTEISGGDASVGREIKYCIAGTWFEDESKQNVPISWGGEPGTSPRKTPIRCLTQRIKFQSLVLIKFTDITGMFGSEGTVVIRVLDKYYSIPINSKGEGTLSLTLETSNTTLTGHMISLTPSYSDSSLPPTEGVVFCRYGIASCGSKSESFETKPEFQITHLQPTTLEFADKTAQPITGKVTYLLSGSDCSVENVLVKFVRASSEQEIGTALTDEAGEFSFQVPRNTVLYLQLKLSDHQLFEGVDGESKNFFQTSGVIIDGPKTNLHFRDIATRTFTLETGVTDCLAPLGHFEMKITGRTCPGSTFRTLSSTGEVKQKIELPAQKLHFELLNFGALRDKDGKLLADGDTIKRRFDTRFPDAARELDLTTSIAQKTFIFHTPPQVQVYVVKGLENIVHSCDSGKTFDFAVTGQSYFLLRAIFFASTPIGLCDIIPSGTELRFFSNLGVKEDPCDSRNGGCMTLPILKPNGSRNISVATQYIYTGEPSTEVGDLSTFVKTVSMSLSNRLYFAEIGNPDGTVPLKDVKLLILGHKILSKDSIVTYFTEDQKDNVPMLYLYSPPASKGSYQQVTFTMNFDVQQRKFLSVKQESGHETAAGVRTAATAELCIPFIGCIGTKAEADLQVGQSEQKSRDIALIDSTSTTFEGKSMTLSTPEGGNGGDDADMVLLLGTVSRYIVSKFVSWDEKSCNVKITNSTVWGSSSESLVFYSRADCKRAVSKLESTIASSQAKLVRDLTIEERKEVESLIEVAESSLLKWFSLFSHWEKDKQQAKMHKVDLRKLAIGGNSKVSDSVVNRLTFGNGAMQLTSEETRTNSGISSYVSYGGSKTQFLESDLKLGIYSTVGVELEVETSVSGNLQSTTSYEVYESTVGTDASTIAVEVSIKEDDPGDSTCLEVFQSPHSKTFVFEVCGGYTQCPHIPGTDSRQKIELSVKERPQSLLYLDKGRVVLELSTADMDEDDEIELVLELDPQTATFPVDFRIGGSSLNQKLQFTLRGKQSIDIYIFFERLDSNLESVEFKGSVSSTCDESIREDFKFDLRWSSACPPANWGGALQALESTFRITQQTPRLQVTAKNLNSEKWRDIPIVDVDISLWAKTDLIGSHWFQVDRDLLTLPGTYEKSSFVMIEDNNGFATLEFDPSKSLSFRDGQRYFLQLRSQCSVDSVITGETRSSVRLGVVDRVGPKLIAKTITPRVNAAFKSVPIASMVFNEPIDCSTSALQTYVTAPGHSPTPASTYCTSDGKEMSIFLTLTSNVEVDFWSNADVDLTLSGVTDVWGNPFVESKELQRMSGLNDPIFLSFTLPQLTNMTGSESDWRFPSQAEAMEVTESFRRSILHWSNVGSAYFLPTQVVDPTTLQPSEDSNNEAPSSSFKFSAGLLAVVLALT